VMFVANFGHTSCEDVLYMEFTASF